VNAPARSPGTPGVIVTTPEQVDALVRNALADVLAEMMPTGRAADDSLLDRAGAARYLGISLAKLDGLCRRDEDPLPWSLCGDSRRFFREDLATWVRRQRGGKAK
jgi:hypothetical protein